MTKPENKKAPLITKGEMLIITLVSRFGLLGAFFVLLMIYATKAQYQEFIDIFILLKIPKNSSVSPTFVLIYLIIGFGGTIFFLLQRMRIKDERIRILENDLRILQESVQRNIRPQKKKKVWCT